MNRLHKRLEMLIETVFRDKNLQRLIKRLKRHQDEILIFLDYDLSPYNNHAEQQTRPLVISRKISQQNRSEAGAQAQAILISLFRTAVLQGLNPVEYVKELGEKAIKRQHLQKNKNNKMNMAA